MTSIVFAVLGIILSVPVLAADQSVRPLYESRSFTPSTYIPFKVESTNGAVEILKASFLPETKDCGVILDPYRKDFFLIKCNKEVDGLNVQLTTLQNGVGRILNYGPLTVEIPFADVVVVGPSEPGVDPDVLTGKQLFSVHCVNCHSPASSKKHATVASLNAAIVFSTGQAQMNGKNSTSTGCTDGNPATICPLGVDLRPLSPTQIANIVKYLGSLK